MVEPLEKFYAVTVSGSVYLASITKGTEAALLKIAAKGNLLTELGKKFTAPILAIADSLVLYIPEGGGTSFQREVTRVNTGYWIYQTTSIVALFADQTEAIVCSNIKDVKRCDLRWKKNTIAILKAIGNEHPRCSISSIVRDFWLMPPGEWQS